VLHWSQLKPRKYYLLARDTHFKCSNEWGFLGFHKPPPNQLRLLNISLDLVAVKYLASQKIERCPKEIIRMSSKIRGPSQSRYTLTWLPRALILSGSAPITLYISPHFRQIALSWLTNSQTTTEAGATLLLSVQSTLVNIWFLLWYFCSATEAPLAERPEWYNSAECECTARLFLLEFDKITY
jgi:hypothetical protein